MRAACRCSGRPNSATGDCSPIRNIADRKQRDDETRGDVQGGGRHVRRRGRHAQPRQTSLVIEPANGRVPARTPAADQRMAAIAKAVNPLLPRSGRTAVSSSAASAAARWRSLPTLYGNGLRIVQAPGRRRDQPRDDSRGAHHLPSTASAPGATRSKSYMGYSTGRWDGDTLVIETSAASPIKTALAGTRHTREAARGRALTRTADDTITYEATVSRSRDMDRRRGRKRLVPLTTQPGYEVFPYDCHEGNNALRNMLSAARAEEKVIEEYVKKGLPPPPLARPDDGDILPADPSFGRRR